MIYPARATTREARTLDTSRNRARSLPQSARIRESSRASTTSSGTAAATGSTPAAFRSSLWDAFGGTPARPVAGAATANSSTTATIPPPSPSGSSARVEAATSSGTRNTATPTTTPTTANAAAASGTSGTRTITQNNEAAPTNPVPPNTDLLNQVRSALNSVGLNPDQYNLRVGSLTISYPNIPTYEYPVLFADINGQTAGFYLNGVAQNPNMFAANVSSMLGRPVMYQV